MTLTNTYSWIFVALSWLLAVGWLWQAAQWILHSGDLADLNRCPRNPQHPVQPGGLPNLTVIVPACNEQASIEATLTSLLASQGLSLQILAVDDRSTDQTGEIMDRLASRFAQTESRHTLEIIHIRDLPSGWLGKPHALATAARRAQAEWILFTDGDVLFDPHAAQLALDYAITENADHVVLMPDWIIKTFGEAAMHGALHALTAWTLHIWRVADPKARDFLGVGAFNLVRRTTYQALGGFEALRMEVLEDLRLGWLLKRAGFRQRVVLGPGLAAVRWSHGAWGVVRNLEKNLFALYRYNIAVTLLAGFGVALQVFMPLAAIAAGGSPRIAGVLIYAAIACIYITSRKVTRVPPAYMLLFPPAAALFLFAIFRSMFLALLRGGVRWRGTLYSLKELRSYAGKSWR